MRLSDSKKGLLAVHRAVFGDERFPAAEASPTAPAAAPLTAEEIMGDKSQAVEHRCKLAFESDAAIRAEFRTLGTFTAYQRALEQGRIGRT